MSKTLPVQKNEYIDVIFEDLTHDGAGVAKVEGYPLFVPNGLPGEKAKIKVIKVNKGYGFGRLMEITKQVHIVSSPSAQSIKNAAAASYSI